MTAYMSNEELVKRITDLERQILELHAEKIENELKEVSLFKAARLMSRGASFVISLIESKQLPARKHIVQTPSKTITRYRILVSDIHKYQTGQVTIKIKDKTTTSGMTDIIKNIIKEFPSKNICNLNNRG